jgi:hypothetical protein
VWFRRFVVIACVAATAARAQSAVRSVQTDARWQAWLGCWQADTTTTDQRRVSPAVTCVVPIAGSAGVEALTILHGKIIVRDRLDANGRQHPLNGQGCDGVETASWSPTGRRVYLHSSYSCGATKGTSATMFALSQSGEWLRVDDVQSGGGSLVTVERRHDVGISAEVPSDAARAIARQQLAINTARAAASAPITTDEIIDAAHSLDAAVVRSWVVASEQQFALDEQQTAALVRADLPPSVMQAVMGSGERSSQEPNRASDVYLNTPGYNTAPVQATDYPQMSTMYRCPPPSGCYTPGAYSSYNGYGYSSYNAYGYSPYSPYYTYPYLLTAPIIVRRGVTHEPFRQPERPQHPVRPRDPVSHRPGGRRP